VVSLEHDDVITRQSATNEQQDENTEVLGVLRKAMGKLKKMDREVRQQ
jgi:hypothetical protein